MKITIQEARKRLAKSGIELGQACHQQLNSGRKTSYQVTTPIGTQLYLQAREVVGLLRDLESPAIQF